jgi:hypothetical protein
MDMTKWMFKLVAVILTGTLIGCLSTRGEVDLRRTISLDGEWQIAEGGMNAIPSKFNHTVPVPGLVDRAKPVFEQVGVKSVKREAFWYRRTFRVDGPIPAVARLKVHKAMFGTRVFLNGQLLGDHLPSFTPGYFNAKPALKVGDNEIIVRVGAFRDSVPKTVPSGWDYEKYRFCPGIFDSVELILSGSPYIARVQAVPDIEKKSVTVHAWVRNDGATTATKLRFTIREAKSGREAGVRECEIPAAGEGPERTGQVTIELSNCRLWSPEDPFLYDLEVRSDADVLSTRFGMRSFKLDPVTGRAMLNGKPYFLRGSNITLYRFFEDPDCGDKPWRKDWVERLHAACRDLHWNSLRYCIGFPPEFWYRIADEQGILIQDEFPIWVMEKNPDVFDTGQLVQEYTEWMQERWNHPSVVVWDACNETRAKETGEAIQKVRALDFSNRPWDNGWSPPVALTDVLELHPYHFQNPNYKLANITSDTGMLGRGPGISKNAIIVNEYGWLWLNRDGTPTTLTKNLYRNLLGEDSTTEQRRHLYARYTAAETEFWRSHRACAAVMHFCALGYSRSGEKPRPQGGATSDHWLDLEKLTWEPEFLRYVRDSFAPVGIMIDAWAADYPGGQAQEFPVVLINDLYQDWNGKVRFRLNREGKLLQEQEKACEVKALGDNKLSFLITVPAETGKYQVEAALLNSGSEPVCSLRDFVVMSEEERERVHGLAYGKPVKASSNQVKSGATAPEAAVDGRTDTRWSSEFSDPQWLAVDLGKPSTITRVELAWERAYARSYAIQVSADGETWRDVYKTANGAGGNEKIRFDSTPARWVRFYGTQRATGAGYSLWEMRVFSELGK